MKRGWFELQHYSNHAVGQAQALFLRCLTDLQQQNKQLQPALTSKQQHGMQMRRGEPTWHVNVHEAEIVG